MAKETTTYGAIIGYVLEEQRRAAGYTQGQAAELADVQQSAWSKLKGGDYNASMPVLRRMAAAVNVSMGELFARTDFIVNALEAYGMDVVDEDRRRARVKVIVGDVLAGIIMAIKR